MNNQKNPDGRPFEFQEESELGKRVMAFLKENAGGHGAYDSQYNARLILKFFVENAITRTDWLGEMGWYMEKNGTWHHDDEAGYFENTTELFNHYNL